MRAGVRAFGDFVQPNCSLYRLLLSEKQLVSVFSIRIQEPEFEQVARYATGYARVVRRAPSADFTS